MKKVQSVFCVFLCIVLCLGVGPFESLKASAATMTPPALSGTTYNIVSASNLRWIAGVCNGTIKSGTKNYPSNPSFKNYSFVLKNNISLGNVVASESEYILTSGERWIPIGTEETPFSGNFEGGEFIIDGVFVEDAGKYNGFFGFVSGGIIHNLNVNGYVGGSGFVGGIVGKLSFGEINGCIFFGKVCGDDKTGGIAGEVTGENGNPSKIFLSVASCDLTAESGVSAGGIVGTASHTNIVSCSSGGSLFSLSKNTAGTLGEALEGVIIDSCSSSEYITADGDETYAGGILGASYAEVNLRNNSFGGLIYCGGKSISLCGGIAGSFSGKIENSFVNGTVCSSLYYNESSEITGEIICASAGIAAKGENGIINNCYFSGASECQGFEGFNICSEAWQTEINNAFYSYGDSSFLIYGSNDAYGSVELLSALKKWCLTAGEGYADWVVISGVNNSNPMLKYANAAGSDGKYAWKYENTVFTFSTVGAMKDYFENGYGIFDTPWAVYRTSVKTLNIKEGVTKIGNNAFNDFSNLRTLNLPSSLKEIGDYAFEQCVLLKNFTLPKGVYDIGAGAFRKCKSLTKIILPYGIRAIRKYTFSYCEKLSSVSIPESVSLIGQNAFAMCDSLVNVSLPQSVREIDSYAFYWCDKLSGVSLPSNLNRIGKYAFGRCEALVDFDIPQNALVEENAFWSVVPKGDIDGDGRYTVFDYIKIKAHFLGSSSLSKAQIKAADSDFDGIVTATDYLHVKRMLLGK